MYFVLKCQKNVRQGCTNIQNQNILLKNCMIINNLKRMLIFPDIFINEILRCSPCLTKVGIFQSVCIALQVGSQDMRLPAPLRSLWYFLYL